MAVNFDLHYPTADLIEIRFQEGVRAASSDKNKPKEQETVCPYTNEYERRWWIRGYHSKEREISNLQMMALFIPQPHHNPFTY